MKAWMKSALIFFLNLFIIKRKNTVFARCRLHFPESTYDIVNPSSSNVLCVLDAYLHSDTAKKVTVYLEYSDNERLPVYEEYVKALNGNVKLILLPSRYCFPHLIKRSIHRLKNLIIRLSTTVWICENGDTFPKIKLPCQKIICMNYFISCKNDLMIGESRRWARLDGLVTTSLLASQIVSSSIGAPLEKCHALGFPRNDAMFRDDKKEVMRKWISEKVSFEPKHIVIYAPTYRDYELEDKSKNQFWTIDDGIPDEHTAPTKCQTKRSILGYEADSLDIFLKETQTVLIYNLHSLQRLDILDKDSCMIRYEETYDFTLYDLMAIADCMITDYSSIGYDFLLRDKPLIYNVYDLELYTRLRGLSYDPYEMFCPGHMVANWTEMKAALTDVINGNDVYKDKRANVSRLLHKYMDGESTKRVMGYFDSLFR